MLRTRIEQLETDLDMLERDLGLADAADDRTRIMDLEALCYATNRRIDVLKERLAEAA